MIETNKLGTNYIEALRLKYQSEMKEAEANLSLYVTNLSAIGEHSDLLEEHDKWIEKWVNSNDKLEAVNKLFNFPG